MELTPRQKSLLRSRPDAMNGYDGSVAEEIGELIAADLLEAKPRIVKFTHWGLHLTDAGRTALAEPQ